MRVEHSDGCDGGRIDWWGQMGMGMEPNIEFGMAIQLILQSMGFCRNVWWIAQPPNLIRLHQSENISIRAEQREFFMTGAPLNWHSVAIVYLKFSQGLHSLISPGFRLTRTHSLPLTSLAVHLIWIYNEKSVTNQRFDSHSHRHPKATARKFKLPLVDFHFDFRFTALTHSRPAKFGIAFHTMPDHRHFSNELYVSDSNTNYGIFFLFVLS